MQNPLTYSYIWDAILSMDETSIIKTIKELTNEKLNYIQNHLRKMVTETGWHPSQKASAEFALKIIEESSKSQ